MNRIALHGLPRTGTSWVGEVFNSCPSVQYRYQPLFSYPYKSYLSTDSGEEKIIRFFEAIFKTNDDFVLRTTARRKGECPEFSKCAARHILYKEVRYHQILPNLLREDSGIKIILLLRNPLSTINSWLNAPREFRSDLGWQRLEEWRYALKKNINRPEEFNGYERWKEATLLFVHLAEKYPERVVTLNYASLIDDPYKAFKMAFAKLDLEFGEQTRQFLHDSSSSLQTDSYSVFRKNQTDDKWREQLELEIIEAIRRDMENTSIKFLLPDA